MKKRRFLSVAGYAILFVTIAVIITVAIMVFDVVSQKFGGDKAVLSVVIIFGVGMHSDRRGASKNHGRPAGGADLGSDAENRCGRFFGQTADFAFVSAVRRIRFDSGKHQQDGGGTFANGSRA